MPDELIDALRRSRVLAEAFGRLARLPETHQSFYAARLLRDLDAEAHLDEVFDDAPVLGWSSPDATATSDELPSSTPRDNLWL